MIGRRDYATRRAARIERLIHRASKLEAEGNARLEQARKITDMIPMGQPILVGHHSEKRHRKDIDRIHNGFSKGFGALKAAEECKRRAEAAWENGAISSDDPLAIELLRDKLRGVENERARGVALNKAGRAKDPIGALRALGVEDPERLIEAARKRVFGDESIVASYRIRNLGAEARRLQKRIAELESRAATPEKEPEQIGAIRIEESENRVQLYFPDKPAAEVRATLKSHGFRWSPTVGAWQRMAGPDAWYWARQIAGSA